MMSKPLMAVLGLPLLALLAGAAVMHVAGEEDAPASALPPSPARPGALAAGQGAPSSFLGVIVAEESVDLTATLEGRVDSVRVRLGDRLKRGDVVALLDSRALQRELAVAEAELLAARADEEVATYAQTEAAERLQRRGDPKQLSTGALSEEELATARYQERMATAKLGGARAQVLQQEARVKQIRQRLSETSLVAPFDAVVASRYVDSGALVMPGRPIVHLLRADGRKVRFAIPADQGPRVAVGMPMRVDVPGHPVHLQGKVLGLSPEVDVASRMIFGLASLEEPEGTPPVPAGTAVRVSAAPDATAGVPASGAHETGRP